jgi:hypothetical protein
MTASERIREARQTHRFVPCTVVVSGTGGNTYLRFRVIDRETGKYVATIPPRFVARGSAEQAALNLNRTDGRQA